MYLKFVDGLPVIAPRRMPEADALAAGFKPVTLTEPPETDDRHYAVERLEELPDRFVRHWDIEELPEPDPELSDEEALAILLGGDGA